MNKIQKIIQNSLYFFSSNFVTFTLGLVSSIILARALKPDNLGVFHQVQWFAGIISTIISFGFITSIVKFTASFKAQGKSQNILSMIKFIVKIELIITVFSTIALVFFSSSIADYYFSPKEAKYFMLAFIAITPGMQTAIFSSLLEGVQIFKYQSIHALTITPLSLSTKIYLMLNGFGIESLLWTNLIFAVINLGFYFWAAKKEDLLSGWFSAKKFPQDEKKKLLSYNYSVFSIHLIDQVVWNRSENFFLGRFCQASELAFYNLSHNLIMRITGIIPMLMWKILLPLMSEHEETNSNKHKQKIFHFSIRYSAFIIIPLITICMVCAFELIVILYGQEYVGAEACFQILCIGAMLSSLTQPGSAAIYSSNKQKFIFWYGSVLAVINIGLNLWLIPLFKAQGAALCYTLITIAGSLGGFYYTRKYLGLKLPYFSILKICFACMCLAMVVFFLIRQDISSFNVFSEFRHWADINNHRIISALLDPRKIRLLFSVSSGICFYLLISLVLFKPSKEDKDILKAFEKYVPNFFIKGLLKIKGKHGENSIH